MSGFICLLSAIKESPSGENTLAGRNDRTDLHLSLQLTLTTPAAYRNDRWCRAVWGSQQVHSAFCSFFFFFLLSPTSYSLSPSSCGTTRSSERSPRLICSSQPPPAPGRQTSQPTPQSPFSAPPWLHRTPKLCGHHPAASRYTCRDSQAMPFHHRPPPVLSCPLPAKKAEGR